MENLHLAPDNDEDDLYSGYDYQDNLLDVSSRFLYTVYYLVRTIVAKLHWLYYVNRMEKFYIILCCLLGLRG